MEETIGARFEARAAAPRLSPAAALIGAAAVLVAASAGIVFAREYLIARQRGALHAAADLGPRVLVTRPRIPPPERQIQVPATIHGYIETPVYAKIAGYLKEIRVDKGDRVRKGQVIALLESPEIDKQVADARANDWLARVTDDRNQTLVGQGVIAQQAADNSHAAMMQAHAAYEQLLAMQSYEVIRAPFDGIVTARYVDPGALIPAATTATAAAPPAPIVAMATLSPLRVYADVPQDDSPFIKDGDPAVITATQYPGREFPGAITRHPPALAPETRTMLVEVDLGNSDLALYPGMYATMEIRLRAGSGAPRVPDDALVFRGGKVCLPLVRGNRIRLVPVALGLDDGREVEITNGIRPDDLIALNLGQSVRDGAPVQPVETASR